MKKLIFASFLIFASCTSSFGVTCVDTTPSCPPVFKAMEVGTIAIWTPLYTTESAALTALNAIYNKQLSALKTQNKAIAGRIAVLESNVIKLKEINFLMKKYNSLLNNYTQIRAITTK